MQVEILFKSNFYSIKENLFGFQIIGKGNTMTVRNPMGRSSASSSSAPPAIPRTPRGPDIIPRRSPQFFPDGQPVEFSANPFRAGSAAAGRYNAFSVATSLGQARARGARSADISRAVARGAARLT